MILNLWPMDWLAPVTPRRIEVAQLVGQVSIAMTNAGAANVGRMLRFAAEHGIKEIAVEYSPNGGRARTDRLASSAEMRGFGPDWETEVRNLIANSTNISETIRSDVPQSGAVVTSIAIDSEWAKPVLPTDKKAVGMKHDMLYVILRGAFGDIPVIRYRWHYPHWSRTELNATPCLRLYEAPDRNRTILEAALHNADEPLDVYVSIGCGYIAGVWTRDGGPEFVEWAQAAGKLLCEYRAYVRVCGLYPSVDCVYPQDQSGGVVPLKSLRVFMQELHQ